MDSLRETTDQAMMARCVELSRIAVEKGEYPFGTVIALDGKILADFGPDQLERFWKKLETENG